MLTSPAADGHCWLSRVFEAGIIKPTPIIMRAAPNRMLMNSENFIRQDSLNERLFHFHL
jgi:hypothetical protein